MKKTIKKVIIPFIDEVNQNGRKYTKESLKQLVESFKEKQKEEQVFGELYDNRVNDYTIINLSRIALETTNVFIEKNKLIGEIRLLDTPYGNASKKIIDKLELRPRTIGQVDNTTKEITITKLIAFDLIDKNTDSFKKQDEETKKQDKETEIIL